MLTTASLFLSVAVGTYVAILYIQRKIDGVLPVPMGLAHPIMTFPDAGCAAPKKRLRGVCRATCIESKYVVGVTV